ncbi:retropepsin-like aspartic protease family protein [Vacuolonema iberomarrocanum]|uniref:retropepsin-like aspartic protease family protein n=1 Tax=Vacuolonema iberomarrocanum TaxID=3454632 RepID=UPI0019FE76BB|nr:retroviral-like aspartic protease family protein [filamentous cyanobacterium LEGE 07170]
MELNEESRQAALRLARAGDPEAIAQLLNHALKPKAIKAKVTRGGDRLKVMLEGASVPDETAMVAYLRKSLTRLGATGLNGVQVYGRQAFAAKPAWMQQFTLTPPSSSPERFVSATSKSPKAVPSRPRSTPESHSKPKSTVATSTSQQLQIAFGAIAAIIFMLVGANIRSITSMVTGTPILIARSAGSDGIYEAPIVERIHGIPVVHVIFNDQVFPMMVDTGASGTLITPQMAAALEVRPIGQITSSTANGVAVFDVGYVRKIEIDGAQVANVPVAVGLADLEVGLLGHDFYRYFDILIREDVVEFHPR